MGKTLFSLAHLCVAIFVSTTVELSFFFFFFFLYKYYCDSAKDAVWGWGVGGWGEWRATEAGSTSTGAQEEWPPRQTLIRQRDRAVWMNTYYPQVTVDNLALKQWHWTQSPTFLFDTACSVWLTCKNNNNIHLDEQVNCEQCLCLFFLNSGFHCKTAATTSPCEILSLVWQCSRGSCCYYWFPLGCYMYYRMYLHKNQFLLNLISF